MLKDFTRGMIFKYDEKDEEQYLVLNNIKRNNYNHLLIMPIKEPNKIVIDFNNAIMIKVDAEGNISAEDNEDIIREAINDKMNQ